MVQTGLPSDHALVSYPPRTDGWRLVGRDGLIVFHCRPFYHGGSVLSQRTQNSSTDAYLMVTLCSERFRGEVQKVMEIG